jgi:hypothetical protein
MCRTLLWKQREMQGIGSVEWCALINCADRILCCAPFMCALLRFEAA